jgi:hypothetical protein
LAVASIIERAPCTCGLGKHAFATFLDNCFPL